MKKPDYTALNFSLETKATINYTPENTIQFTTTNPPMTKTSTTPYGAPKSDLADQVPQNGQILQAITVMMQSMDKKDQEKEQDNKNNTTEKHFDK